MSRDLNQVPKLTGNIRTWPRYEDYGNPYEIVEQIGKGAYGVVYRAIDKRDGNEIAIKRIQIPATQKKIRQLEDEVRYLYEITGENCHPNVICYIGHFTSGNLVYIVTEYISGINMTKFIENQWGSHWQINVGNDLIYDESRPFPSPDKASKILHDLLRGIEHLHSYDQVHRDLKPDNIMIRKQSDGNVQAVIIDLGLACMPPCLSKGVGTPIFMAPERLINEVSNQLESTVESLKKSDVHGIGMCMYPYMAGRNFYPDTFSNLDELLQFVMHFYPTLDYRWYPDLKLENIVNHLLVPSPNMRLTISEALETLNPF